MIWAILARVAVAVIASYLSYALVKGQGSSSQAPAGFDDFEFPQFDEGTPITHFFGDCWTDDWMVLGTGGFMPVQFKVSI